MTKQRSRVNNSLRILLAIGIIALFIVVDVYARNNQQILLPEAIEQPDTIPVLVYKPTVISDTVQSNLSFAVDSLCMVSDASHSLDSFFEELDGLAAGKDTVITIVHLGDSHVQAGYFSGRMMRLMHHQFGNAGRGWIAPFKITRTNEPADYFITSVVKEWTSGKITQREKKCPLGPGGIGIHAESPFVNFDVVIAPNNGAGYQFNQIIQYRHEKAMPMLPGGNIKDSVEIRRSGDTVSVPGIVADTFRISCLTDSIELQSTRRMQGTDSLLPAEKFDNLYYGFTLSNGQPGILYHSIGVNGAMFVNYTDESYVRQLALFKPSLLIISLGTNETFGRRFSNEEFTGQIRAFLSLVKKYLPDTAILLTTPPECFKRVWVNKRRTYVRNNFTERAADAIVKLAEKEGLACWDMFETTGGKDSSKKWFDGKWMGRDRIHYNKEGYYEQGTLLFKALMNLKIERETNKE